jgi:hypothetical protein
MATHRAARRRSLAAEGLEPRLCLASSVGWDGPGRGSAVLTYYIANTPASLGQAAVNNAIRTALNAWQAVVDVTFVQTFVPRLPRSIDIRFGPIDGSGRVLAETYLPDDLNPALLAGDVTFDAAERWEVGNGRGRAAFDLVQVAVHELGHALGLGHSRAAGTVMYPTVSPSTRFTALASNDIRMAQSLYATRATPPAEPTPATTTPNTTETRPTIPVAPRPPRGPRFPRPWGRRVHIETTRAAG